LVTQALIPHETRDFEWDRLTVASTLSYCVMVAGLSLGMTLGQLRPELHLSGVVTALHGSTFGIGMFVAGLFGTRALAAFGRRGLFWFAGSGVVIGATVFGLGRSPMVTLIGAIVVGFAAASNVLVQPGIIADHHGPNRSLAFAAVNSYPALCGVGTALVLGAAISAGVSWRVTYVALAVLFFGARWIVARPIDIPEAESGLPEPIAQVFASRALRRAWLNLTLAVMVEMPLMVWAVVYLKEIGRASSGLAPILASMLGLFLFVSRLLMPTLSRLIGPRLREYSLAGVGGSVVLLWMLPSLPAKVGCLALAGFCAGPLYNTSIDRLYASATTESANALGAASTLASGTAVTVAPLALGVLADAVGLRHAILILPALAVVALAVGRDRGAILRDPPRPL
jgi:MFS family permease